MLSTLLIIGCSSIPHVFELNPPQRLAVHYCDGPLLVLAGAGSGKTRVIIAKIVHLVRERGLTARKIAAITFTNKAAREMRERVGKLLSASEAEGLLVCTFHALGLRFLQIEAERTGLRRGFSVFDTDDSAGIIKELLPGGSKPDAVAAMRGLISRAKNAALTPVEAAGLARSPREREAAACYANYQARLAAFNAVDFDDLIRLPLLLLEQDAAIAAAWRERLRYLLVDEYQDTNLAQYRLLRVLTGSRGAMTCVGDDDQSIYAWRGADSENLQQLGRDYPQLKVIALEQNYRCPRRVLRAANSLIGNNPHLHLKVLFSELAEGEPIRVLDCRDAEHEAERVAAEIAFLRQSRGLGWADFAVLFRGNHQSRVLEKALQLLRIPYHLTGGTAFLERGEVKDALAWLRVLANPDDDAAFLRAVAAPKRDVGGAALEKLAQFAHGAGLSLARAASRVALIKQLPARAAAGLADFDRALDEMRVAAAGLLPAELLRRTLERSGLLRALREQCKDEALFARRRDNLEDLTGWIEGARGSGLDGLANQLTLLAHADRGDPGDAVRLMSLHASKGLEFRFVFVIGVQEGCLPHEASLDEGRLEEERRLMYVAMTRTREGLVLSHCARARRFGELLRLEPSRFLDELPAHDLLRDGDDSDQHAQAREARRQERFRTIAALFED